MLAKTRQMTDQADLIDAVVSVLSTGDALGCTTDEIADALHGAIDGAALQHDLEEMVERGILDRRGVGRGALYTLMVPVRLGGAPDTSSLLSTTADTPIPIARKVG